MRRLLPLLLAALFAAVAQPAMANQVVVRGTVPHHQQHFVFRKHAPHDAFIFGSPFLFSNNPFFATSPFAQTTPFVTTSPFVTNGPLFTPFVFEGGLFPSMFGEFSGGFAGTPVALGGESAGGVGAEPRVIVVAMPLAGPPQSREPAHATVEETPSGVTIIRGPGGRH